MYYAHCFITRQGDVQRSRRTPCVRNNRVTLRTLAPNFSATCLTGVPDLYRLIMA